jgi:uncharacterized protein (DUF983 family)
MEHAMSDVSADRPLKHSIARGVALRCPNCGKGKLLHSYLKVVDECSNCGEALHHHRADDGPAYVTILIVGHVMIFGLTLMWEHWRPEPLTMAISIGTLALVTSLLFLPRAKGLIVAYQWAKRMHGFG